MANSLVVVESPAKARTIEKYLGKGFKILASVGHVIDLPQKNLGVDIDHAFAPEYHVIRGKKKVLDEIKRAAQKAEHVYLAPDPDREGEAIACHIADYIGDHPSMRRVTIHEITKRAVQEAINHAGTLDRNKYNAQQARRVLDRIVGYKISPILWKKVGGRLSAGRVQSVAVRLVCEREAEIEAFKPVEYWSIHCDLEGPVPPPFEAQVHKIGGKRAQIGTEAEAQALAAAIRQATLTVAEVARKGRSRRPAPPFITSTLQMEAARKLGFSAKRTMSLAQRLYEGVDAGPHGRVGLITYMRTDSTRLSDEALAAIRGHIGTAFGADYLPATPNVYAKKAGAQDAHEAIRPANVAILPKEVTPFLERDLARLYELVWQRAVASQMTPAQFDATAVDITGAALDGQPIVLRATGQVMTFDGFTRLYREGRDEGSGDGDGANGEAKGDDNRPLPRLAQGDALRLRKVDPQQHFTQPPPRYTEATLVKALEEKGIGRPSTYAATLSTIVDRDYVEKRKGRFHPTHLGRFVNKVLVASFPDILEVGFTAAMEDHLDRVAEGAEDWVKILHDFYGPFEKRLAAAPNVIREIQDDVELTDIKCDKCGAPMAVKSGRTGEFLACTNYPECKNPKSFIRDEEGHVRIKPEEVADEPCPKCGGEMVVKSGRFGEFFACRNYPECKSTRQIKRDPADGRAVAAAADQVTDKKCSKCGKPLVLKEGRYGRFLGCSGYPKCRNIEPVSTGVACPEKGCDGELCEKRFRGRVFYSCSNYPTCKYSQPGKPVAEACPECGFPCLMEHRDKHEDSVVLACPNKECGYIRSRNGVAA
jgi:DNA topoisomerase-1